jgi:hypothetical protein
MSHHSATIVGSRHIARRYIAMPPQFAAITSPDVMSLGGIVEVIVNITGDVTKNVMFTS